LTISPHDAVDQDTVDRLRRRAREILLSSYSLARLDQLLAAGHLKYAEECLHHVELELRDDLRAVAAQVRRYRRDGCLHLPVDHHRLSPYGRARLDRALAATGHVLLRDGRIVHRTTVRPPHLAVDGHAYRNRTRRRTRKTSR